MHSTKNWQKAVSVAIVSATIIALTASFGVSGAQPSATRSGDSASSKDWEAIVAAAKAEGSVTFYTGLAPSQNDPLVKAFTAKYGITVKQVRETTGPLIQRFASESEAGAPAADVITQSDPAFAQSAGDKGWTIKLTTDLLPALADFPADSIQKTSVPGIVFPWGLEYNSETLKTLGVKPPKDYDDLLNPKLDGQIVISDPRLSVGTAWNLEFMSERFGDGFLSGLANLHPMIVAGAVPGVQQLAAGQGAVLISTAPTHAAALVAAGAPLVHVTPEKTGGFAHLISLSARAPHPNAARVFANFALTREGQAALCGGSGGSLLSGVANAYPLPKGLVMIDAAKTVKRLPEIVRLLKLR